MTLRGLSREYGYTGVVFSQVLRHPYARIERILSDILQIPLHEMFPDRWSCNGERLLKRGRPRLKKMYLHDNKESASDSRGGRS